MGTSQGDSGATKIDRAGRNTGVARRRRPRRRVFVSAACMGALLLVAIAATAWLGSKASTISNELKAAAELVPRLKAEVLNDDAQAAAKTVGELSLHTSSARSAADDPIWMTAGALPWIGANFQAASAVATSADDLAKHGATPLVSVFRSLDWKSLTPNDKGVDLTPLNAAKPKLQSAALAVAQSYDRLSGIDENGLFPQIAEPLAQAKGQLASMRGNVDVAADIASLAPDMMGGQSPRRYLLLVQNNAEARATGGIPGALAVLNVSKGKLTLGSQTTSIELGPFVPPLAIDAEQELIYSPRLGRYMQDANLTPNFPTTASTALQMWKQRTGEQLDGVVSIDPVSLGYVLDSTGPLELVDPQVRDLVSGALPSKLTGKNVVKTLLSDVYSEIPEPSLQDLYFAGVAKEIFSALAAGKSEPKKLFDGLARGVAEGRILLWSASSDEQALIANYRVSGSIAGPNTSPAEFGVYFNDGTGAKMDYHVKRTVQLIEECPAGGYSQVKVRVTSTNAAPKDAATSLPKYVTGGGAFGVPAGSVQTNIVAYGPIQSNVETAFVAGKKIGFAAHRHSGRPVGSVTVRLAPGQSSTVEFTFDKIVQHTEPQLAVTPTVQPLKDVVLDTIRAKCVPAT